MPPDRMKDTIVAQHIAEADTARHLYDDGRARLAAKIAEVEAVRERLEAERDAARANFLGARDARDAAILERNEYARAIHLATQMHTEVMRERDAVAAVLDDVRAESGALRGALGALTNSTGCVLGMDGKPDADLIAQLTEDWTRADALLTRLDDQDDDAAIAARAPSAPAPVPEALREALRIYSNAVYAYASSETPTLPEAEGDALLSAISRALAEAREGALRDSLRVARGCMDYGGGHRDDDEHLDIYHHGIQTVINSLEAFAKHGLKDTQTAALYRMGASPPPGKQKHPRERSRHCAPCTHRMGTACEAGRIVPADNEVCSDFFGPASPPPAKNEEGGR